MNRGEKASVSGTLTPAVSGRSVVLERGNGKKWVAIGQDKTDGKGRFALSATTGNAVAGCGRTVVRASVSRFGRCGSFGVR